MGLRKLDESNSAIYRIPRLYRAARDKSGAIHPEKKGTAHRAVERMTDAITRAEANLRLRRFAAAADEMVEQRGITYVYRLRCGTQYPIREEFFVAAPAVVAAKACYSRQWFNEQWQSPRLSLFE